MKPTLWLADYAKVSDGKVDSLGSGWSNIRPQGPFTFFVAGTIEVPWHLTNERHELWLELLDADGQPVSAPNGEGTVHVEGNFEMGRPPGAPQGVPLTLPIVWPFFGLTIDPGRYELRLSIDGETRDDWYIAFTVVAAPPQMRAA